MTGADADTCRERTQEGLRDLFIAFRVSARKAQQRLLIRNQIISAEKHVFIQKDPPASRCVAGQRHQTKQVAAPFQLRIPGNDLICRPADKRFQLSKDRTDKKTKTGRTFTAGQRSLSVRPFGLTILFSVAAILHGCYSPRLLISMAAILHGCSFPQLLFSMAAILQG